ncbi:MAG TPA: spiro-SPASM protein [Spirochaetia bacterium]|nr:spiro-SPASM protein [Spirochaetia bacterium]
MNRVICINAINLSEYATIALPDGSSAFDRVRTFAEALPGVTRIVTLVHEQGSIRGETIEVRSATGSAILDAFSTVCSDESEIIYIHGDTPFLDTGITDRMLESHRRYFAEYSFADGYPYGMAPEILQSSILPLLKRLVAEEDVPLNREMLFSIIQKDINSFDIETEISPDDVRSLRLSLTCDTRRNYLLCRRLFESGDTGAVSLLETIRSKGGILRTLPAYINMQIIDSCPQACSYCPFPVFGGNVLQNSGRMELADFLTIIKRVEDFAPESTVNLSLWGEPSMHPAIAQMIEAVEETKSLSLNIETSGIGWDGAVLDRLSDRGLSRTDWIVSLDASDPQLYRSLRGAGVEEAQATALNLLERFPGRVYIQAVRMNENEEHLESFYRSWKDKSAQVIIQKYDHFAGALAERKVADLSPLTREPCWHLKRDLVVLLDGSVVMCREDIRSTHVLGNLLTEQLETIWARGETLYLRHVAGDYPEICRTCDEYYTYNY